MHFFSGRKVLRSRKNKLQLVKGTKAQPLKQLQTWAGTISKQIIQPVLEESLAQDLLHIAGTALGRKYFFSKGTPSEFTQNMTMCSTIKKNNQDFCEVNHSI